MAKVGGRRSGRSSRRRKEGAGHVWQNAFSLVLKEGLLAPVMGLPVLYFNYHRPRLGPQPLRSVTGSSDHSVVRVANILNTINQEAMIESTSLGHTFSEIFSALLLVWPLYLTVQLIWI